MPVKKKDDLVAAAAKEDFEFTYRQVLNMVGAAGAGNQAGAAYNYDDLTSKTQKGMTTLYGNFRVENDNIFRKYNQLSLISPHVFIPLAKLGLIVVSGLRLESKNKQALEVMNKWSKKINLLEKVENIARSTVKEGTCVVELIKEKKTNINDTAKTVKAKAKAVKGTGTGTEKEKEIEIKGITGLDILPMRYITLLPEGYTVGAIKNTLIKGDIDKILLYEKQNNLETQATFERNEVALFRIFHEGNFFIDVLGRETYSIYGVSLLEAIDRPLKNLLDMMEGYATHMRRYGVGRLHINIPLVEELRKQGRYQEAKQILDDTIATQQQISQNEDMISGGAEVKPLSTNAGGGVESMKAALEADIHIGLLQAPLSMGDTKGSTYAAGRMSEEDRYIVLESVQHIFISTVQKEIIDPQLGFLGYGEGEVEVVIDKLDQPYPDYRTVTDALMNNAITVEEYRAKLGFPEEKPKSKIEEDQKAEAEKQQKDQLDAQKKLMEAQGQAGQPVPGINPNPNLNPKDQQPKAAIPPIDKSSSPDANKSSPDVNKKKGAAKKVNPDVQIYYRTKLAELQQKKGSGELLPEQFDNELTGLRKYLMDQELHPDFDGIVITSGAGSNLEDEQRRWYFANLEQGNIDKEGNITEKGTKAGVKAWVTKSVENSKTKSIKPAKPAISKTGNFPKGQKEMYASNSPKGAFTFKQFIETEIEERGNYPDLNIDKLKQKYGLTDDSKVIWVASEKWIANRYNMESDSENYDNAEDVPEDEMSIYPYTPDQGFIVPETDDGDGGFLYVFTDKKGAAVDGAGIGSDKVGRDELGHFMPGLDDPMIDGEPKTKEQRDIDRRLKQKFHESVKALNANIADGLIARSSYNSYFENLKDTIKLERAWRYKELKLPYTGAEGAAYDESQHPRDESGKWTDGMSGTTGAPGSPTITTNQAHDLARNNAISHLKGAPKPEFPPFVDEQGGHHWNPIKTQKEYDALKKTPIYLGRASSDMDNIQKGDIFDKFSIKGTDVYVPVKDVPDYIKLKFERLERAFEFSNIPDNERPRIIFTGRDDHKQFDYVARDGKKYNTEYAGSASYGEGKLRIYDNFNVNDIIDHEVGHFEQNRMMREGGGGNRQHPTSINGLQNMKSLDDYNNLLTILKDRNMSDRDNVNKLMNDVDFARSSGVMDAMHEKGMKYYDNGFDALWAIGERQAPISTTGSQTLPLELDNSTVKTWKVWREIKAKEAKANKLMTEWKQIYEQEPHTENYAGQNESETFAQSYADIKAVIARRDYMRTAKEVVPYPPYPHPDDSQWAKDNPLKYAFMKKNVFKKQIKSLKGMEALK